MHRPACAPEPFSFLAVILRGLPGQAAISLAGLCLLTACGGPPPAEAPAPEVEVAPEPAAPKPAEPAEEAAEPAEEPTLAEPEFTPGMSVEEAVSAVPRGAERMNLDEATLGKPLADFELYEPCKPGANQKWQVRVAVWQGKAVGVDVNPTPPNAAFASCVAERIRALTWRDRVPSLNTVEYAF